jgi:micrococcal nuclease
MAVPKGGAMTLNCRSRRFLVLVALLLLPGIALGQDKTTSTGPAKEGSRSPAATGKITDGSKRANPKNSGPANGEINDAPRSAKNEVVSGKVAYVTDGDTLTLQAGKTQYKVRLLGVDAPEDGQPYSAQARKALSDKVLQKTVQVTTYGHDIYGNTLGIVNADGKNVNLELVKEGLAWHYAEYSASKTLANAEQEARKAKIGLWADENPTPPWQWRKQTSGNEEADPFDPKNQASVNAGKAAKPATDQTQGYWLTTASNTRHNSKCRYYEKTKGRPCGPNEGKACKICGG